MGPLVLCSHKMTRLMALAPRPSPTTSLHFDDVTVTLLSNFLSRSSAFPRRNRARRFPLLRRRPLARPVQGRKTGRKENWKEEGGHLSYLVDEFSPGVSLAYPRVLRMLGPNTSPGCSSVARKEGRDEGWQEEGQTTPG